MERINVYQIVTDRIIEQMNNGIIPWMKPWNGGNEDVAISYTTRKAYSMLNQWLLGEPGEYLTFAQIKKLGGSVKKGAKSRFVVYFEMVKVTKQNEQGGESGEIYSWINRKIFRYLQAGHKRPRFFMEIIYRPLADIKPNPKNPRNIQPEEKKRLAESIKGNPKFFEARPILLSDRTGELIIIAGEQRSAAAALLGMQEVPTILISGLTEAEEDEIMVKDNTHSGKWDEKKLAEIREQWGDGVFDNWIDVQKRKPENWKDGQDADIKFSCDR